MLPSGRRLAYLSALPLLLTGVVLPVRAAGPASPTLLPYTITLVGGGASANPAQGAACALGSPLTATDAYGDGCLATQVKLPVTSGTTGYGAQFVTADAVGNIYFSDTANSIVRRIDARTGIITLVAGGAASSPGASASCGSGSNLTSSDVLGDGCLARQVKLSKPEGIAFSPVSGDLFFADSGSDTVRRISGATGVISSAAGNTGNTFGYAVNSSAGNITAANSNTSYLNFPYGIAFDARGDLYIADEGNNAIEAVNMGSATVTIANVSIPPGTIAKIIGYGSLNTKSAAGECPNFTAAVTGSRGGCYFAKWTDGSPAITSNVDAPYSLSVDAAGNVYFANEFNDNAGQIRADGTIYNFAGIQGTKAAITTARGTAGTFGIGSSYGANYDSWGNLYVADSVSNVIWRVDATTLEMYVLAGGASTVCSSGDSLGNGCPATQAKFTAAPLNGSGFASAPGVFGLYTDPAGNLLVMDSLGGEVRKISTGAQFPLSGTAINATVTQSVAIHFSAGDGPATSGAYSIAPGFGDFTLGTAACTTNSDTTSDCVVPVSFKPSAMGLRSAPLVVKGTGSGTTTFALTGTGLGAALGIDPGVQTTVASTGVTAVSGIAVDGAGNVFAAVPGASSITVELAVGGTGSVGTGLNGASAVAVDAAGNVFVALSSGSVVKVPSNGGAQATIGSGFQKPAGIAVDQFGSVYVSDQTANTVTKLQAGSYAPSVISNVATLNGPSGLAVDTAGNIYVANTIGNSVARISANYGSSSAIGSGLSAPTGVAVDAAGSLYVADTHNGRVVFIPNENGTMTTADQITVETGFISASDVKVAGTTLYVSDNGANSIVKVARGTGAFSFGNDPTGTALTNPAALTSDGNAAVAFNVPYFTASGNTGDFTLTPSTLSGGSSLIAGYGVALSSGFNPTTTGARSAVYTFAATNLSAAATLTLSGTGITPTNPTSTSINATPTSGTYGQTVAVTVTVAVTSGSTPTGTVTVKVDTTTYTPTLNASGVATLSLPGLSATQHVITASYPGDVNSGPSTATPVPVTLAKAALTIAINNVNKPYLAPLPAFTSTSTGVVNNDAIGVSYSTTATQSSALGTYPINGSATGSAVSNYTVTVTPGVLTVVKASTATTVSASSTAVSAATPVTLTATVSAVSPATGVPTGTVTFYNGATALGSAVAVNGSGVASTTVTFTITGQSTTNNVTAVYSGDTNYTTSTSANLVVTSSYPGFNLGTISSQSLTISQGQTGITSFVLTPSFGYNGTVTFACTGIPATMSCTFSPSSIVADGKNTPYTIGLAVGSTQPGPVAKNNGGSNLLPVTLTGGPLLALLLGFGLRRRRPMPSILRYGMVLLLGAGLLSVAGCSSQKTIAGTPKGTSTITVVATGTPGTGGGTTNVTQQFTVSVTVQ